MIEAVVATEDPDLIADAVLSDMELLSREEWFEIARKAGHGGFGFSPMRVLQSRIRDQPLRFGPQLWGIFMDHSGLLLLRHLPWWRPNGWKIARRWTPSGWVTKKGLDPEIYKRIDALLNDWDRAELLNGPDHFTVKRAIENLIKVCVHDIEDR